MSDSQKRSNQKELAKTKPVSRRSVERAMKQSETTQTPSIESRRAKAANVETMPEGRVSTRSGKAQHISPTQKTRQANLANTASVQKQTRQATRAASATTPTAKNEKINKNPTNDADRKKAGKMLKSQKKREKRSAGRSFMNVLMVTYIIVVGIIGIWGVKEFFWFYVQEKSPVMAAGTKNSRVENTPDFSASQLSSAKDAVMAAELPIKDVAINQVGPTIHFFITVNDDVDRGKSHEIGKNVLNKFAETVENNEVFGTYEAQIIITKEGLEKPDPEIMLRPAANDGEERHFPQYGVSNEKTGGKETNISWSRNGD